MQKRFSHENCTQQLIFTRMYSKKSENVLHSRIEVKAYQMNLKSKNDKNLPSFCGLKMERIAYFFSISINLGRQKTRETNQECV